MMITKNNLDEIIFENHDARLLIEYIVSHTQATLYYYREVELTVENALKMYNLAIRTEDESSDRMPYINRYNKNTKDLLYL